MNLNFVLKDVVVIGAECSRVKELIGEVSESRTKNLRVNC